MPSTTTTSFTIGTILDLIGPTTPSTGNSDGQSGFDSLLQATQAPPRAPTPGPVDSRPSAATDSRSTDRNQQASADPKTASDPTTDNSIQNAPSQSAPAATATPPAGSGDKGPSDPADPEHDGEKADDQLSTEQIIAQSLAGLPTTSTNGPEPAVIPTDAVANVDENSGNATKTTGAGAVSSAEQAKAANQQQKISTVDADAQEENDSDNDSQTKSGKVASAVAVAAVNEFPAKGSVAKQQAEGKTQAISEVDEDQVADDEAQQTSDMQLTGDDKSQSQPTQIKDDRSQAADVSPLTLDVSALSTPSADSAPTQAATATPLVAPTTNASPVADSHGAGQSINSSAATTMANAQSRPRLSAQALAPAANTAMRHAPVEIDTARLISRVVRAFSAAQDRDGEVRLRLSPPELGSLQLDVRVENGALTAHLQTETDSARLAIIDNLPALRDRLAEQGVRIERFDVDLMQRQPGGTPDQPGGRQSDTSEAPLRFPPAAASSPAPTPQPSASSASLVNSGSGGLNVII